MKLFFLFLCSALFFSCSHNKKKYPQHWWSDQNIDKPKSWEILPSQAQYPEVILSKRNELGILSNFAATPFDFQGLSFASVEGLWQSTKFPENKQDSRYSLARWPYTRRQVQAMSGFQAKRAGDFASQVMKKHNINWVSFKGRKMLYREPSRGSFFKLILAAMQAKVKQNKKVEKILKSTQGLKLLPDHHQAADAPPAWKYFSIYEQIRYNLIQDQK